MIDHINAMLCEPADGTEQYLTDPSWVASPKLDGMRLIVTRDRTGVTFTNRNGEAFLHRVPNRLSQEFFQLEYGAILDGELVDSEYHVFDVLSMPGGSCLGMPFNTRMFILDGIFTRWQPVFTVRVPVLKTEYGKRNLLKQVSEQGGEGVVFKNSTSLYLPGVRSIAWRKLKLWKTADCIIAKVSPTGKQSVDLALLHRGEWPGESYGTMKDGVHVAKVGSCLVRQAVLDRMQPGMVMETRYLYTTTSGRLYQPSFIRLRSDKDVHECWTDQLQLTSKKLDIAVDESQPADVLG